MKSKANKYIFIGLNIVAWLIFVGLSIEAGGIIVNFIYSLVKPEVVAHLYQKLDLSLLYQKSIPAYYSIYSFLLAISVLKAILFYLVVDLLLKLDLNYPFNSIVAKKITNISYFTAVVGVLGYIAKEFARNLSHKGYELNRVHDFWVDYQAFMLMSAVIYIIAQIFKKGVELQSENDFTV